MKKTQTRQKLCRQIGLIELNFTIAYASGLPIAGGLDAAFIDSVEDTGTGVFKVNFKDIAQRFIVPVSIQSSTTGLYSQCSAVDKQSITVTSKTFGGVLTDSSVSVQCLYHEARDLY